MEASIIDFASRLFPFKNIKTKNLEAIFSEISYTVSKFSKGEIIFSPSNFQKKVGFIIEGECEIQKLKDEDSCVPLNTLSRYASFGILSVLSPNSEYPTRIISTKQTSVLFICAEDMIAVIKKYPTIAMNVISFLTTRISFLNQKIDTFSEKSTLKKLSSYLLNKFHESGEKITVSRTKLSAEIGVGRASLYRDLETLESKNVIKTNQKEIIIICPKGLERI